MGALVGCPGRCDSEEEEDYRQLDACALAERLDERFADRAATDMGYWQVKPQLAATYVYPLRPERWSTDVRAVAAMKGGECQVSRLFPAQAVGVPPPWDDNPFDNRTYDLYLHALQWTVPLTRVWASTEDTESLRLKRAVVESWIRSNSQPPGMSPYAWGDHATASRLQVFCWFWELWRTSDDFDAEFARLLLASIYQHAVYMTDTRQYTPTSNHALHMDGALLAAALTFPEFAAAAEWRALAERRLSEFMERNFSPAGFNLEQSPAYHLYVVEQVGRIIAFLRANGQPLPRTVMATTERSIAVWPWLLRADGQVANVGDSAGGRPSNWRRTVAGFWGDELPPAAPSSGTAPRPEAGGFLVCDRAGYAICTSYPIEEAKPATDIYALFRCNSWRHSSHCHCDALSFVLFGLGREWLVDSGKLNYEETTPERKYMISARAHNVLLVDQADFDFCPVEVVDFGRTAEFDFVVARHELPSARHERRFEFHPPRTIVLVDEVGATDGAAHTVTQLFHAAPDLQVEILSARQACLHSPDGSRCVIEQTGDEGMWSVITGQTEPVVQGWYSREFNERVPSPVLHYTSAAAAGRHRFETRIELRRDEGAPGD
jgi:hypothetical protein